MGFVRSCWQLAHFVEFIIRSGGSGSRREGSSVLLKIKMLALFNKSNPIIIKSVSKYLEGIKVSECLCSWIKERKMESDDFQVSKQGEFVISGKGRSSSSSQIQH